MLQVTGNQAMYIRHLKSFYINQKFFDLHRVNIHKALRKAQLRNSKGHSLNHYISSQQSSIIITFMK